MYCFLASSWNREADGDRSVATQTMQSAGSYGQRRLWPSQKSTTRSFSSVLGMQLVTVSSNMKDSNSRERLQGGSIDEDLPYRKKNRVSCKQSHHKPNKTNRKAK